MAVSSGLELVDIGGPGALVGGPRRLAYLAGSLAWLDFKLRFFGSVLGYLWQLVRPMAMFGVLYVVFTHVVRIGTAVDFYAVVLLTNIVLYTWFIEATSAAVTSMVDRENIVRKIHFPRLAVPGAAVLTASFNAVLNGIVVIVFAIASGVRPHWTWLEVPFLLFALGVLIAGVAMLLSALYVRFRDVKPIWDVFSQLLFYGSPILYVASSVDAGGVLRDIMVLNPLGTILTQMRHALIDPSAPTAAEIVGHGWTLVLPAAIIVAVAALGYVVFDRAAPRIAEEL